MVNLDRSSTRALNGAIVLMHISTEFTNSSGVATAATIRTEKALIQNRVVISPASHSKVSRFEVKIGELLRSI